MDLSSMLEKHWQIAAVITAAIAVILLLTAVIFFGPASSALNEREVIISSGMGAADVGALLAEHGVIRSARAFRLYVRLAGTQSQLQAGRYLVCPCDSVPTIVNAIASGAALSDDLLVTVPEGLNVWEIDGVVSAAGLAGSGSFVSGYLEDEGRLFPDSYRLGDSATAVELAEKMQQTFTERTSGYSDEQVIVASILEKEAKTAEDMALVAGIIYERLDIGMALQIDATVAYGWCLRRVGDTGVCDVTQAPIATELSVDGPYNTYTRRGLPVGPISNPGIKALEAAAHPTESDYLFYLSTRDGSELIYSETAEEHLQNRRKHLGF